MSDVLISELVTAKLTGETIYVWTLLCEIEGEVYVWPAFTEGRVLRKARELIEADYESEDQEFPPGGIDALMDKLIEKRTVNVLEGFYYSLRKEELLT